MKKASLLIFLNKDYNGTNYSFERCGYDMVEYKGAFFKEGQPKEYINVINNVEIELLVAYSDESDKELISYFKPIANQMINTENDSDKAYDRLLKLSIYDNICIFNPYVFVQEHWLTELIYYYDKIPDSGIVSISSDTTNCNFAPLLSIENGLEIYLNVFIPKNEQEIKLNSMLLFSKEKLKSINTDINLELASIQGLFKDNWLNNYYIPSQTCIVIED